MVTHEPNVSSFILLQNPCNHYLAEGNVVSFDVLMLVCCLLSGPWFRLRDHLGNWDCGVYSFDYFLLFMPVQLTFWMHLGFLYWEKALAHSLSSLYFSCLFCLSVWDLYNYPELLELPTCHEDYLLLLQFFAIFRLFLGPNQRNRKVDFSS